MLSPTKIKKAAFLLNEKDRIENELAVLLGREPKRKPQGPYPGRVLQGRYMGVTKNLPAAKKRAVKLVREERGIEAAIQEARNFQKAETH